MSCIILALSLFSLSFSHTRTHMHTRTHAHTHVQVVVVRRGILCRMAGCRTAATYTPSMRHMQANILRANSVADPFVLLGLSALKVYCMSCSCACYYHGVCCSVLHCVADVCCAVCCSQCCSLSHCLEGLQYATLLRLLLSTCVWCPAL